MTTEITPGSAAFAAFTDVIVKHGRGGYANYETACDDIEREAWEAAGLGGAEAHGDDAQLLAERDAARAVVAEMIDAFGPSGSGQTARVGQVQLAKWHKRAGLPVNEIADGRRTATPAPELAAGIADYREQRHINAWQGREIGRLREILVKAGINDQLGETSSRELVELLNDRAGAESSAVEALTERAEKAEQALDKARAEINRLNAATRGYRELLKQADTAETAAKERAEKAERGARTLGMVVSSQARAIYAAGIEVARGDLRAAGQWVLSATPDVDDNLPDQQWNGTETSQEWFDRTRPEPMTDAAPAAGATS